MERENTLILYSTNNDNTFAYEGIADVYDKNINIQVYKEDIDIENNTCIGTWANAEIVQMESLQEIEIYFVPDGFTIEEWKDVIRVTPNYEFPVKTKDNKIINKYAYLLETGDELLFEETQYNTNNDGVIDIYGTTQNNGNLVNECVWSNGGSYIGKDADGKFVYRLEDPETVEGLQFALDCLNNYSATYGEDAQWDAYKEGYLNGKAVFLPDDAYNGTPGNMLQDMKDDFGFVCFPKGPKAKDYVNCWSNNPIVIPGCYDKDKAWKLAFAWRVWNSDVPGYENYEGWKSNYYSGMRDTRSVDETLEILRTHGMIDYSGVVPNVSVGSDFVWSVAPGADLTSIIEGIRDTWKTYIDDANKG